MGIHLSTSGRFSALVLQTDNHIMIFGQICREIRVKDSAELQLFSKLFTELTVINSVNYFQRKINQSPTGIKFKFDGFSDIIATIQIPNPISELFIHAYN